MHFFIIPTTSCNSGCSYCYSNMIDAIKITDETFYESVSFIKWLSKEQSKTKTSITFHGGEPLLADSSFFGHAIPYIAEVLGSETSIGIQSNLWLLNEKLVQLFKQYHVVVGTSLDGPQAINELQRGKNYFDKTFSGIALLKKQGLPCGCIATFTKSTSDNLEQIFDFFVSKELHFEVHAAIKPPAPCRPHAYS